MVDHIEPGDVITRIDKHDLAGYAPIIAGSPVKEGQVDCSYFFQKAIRDGAVLGLSGTAQ